MKLPLYLGLIVMATAAPLSAQVAAPSKIVVPGSDCEEGGCRDAPSSVYECIARELTPNPVTHGRLFGAMRRLERSPSADEGERFRNLIERTSCDARSFRLRLGDLKAVTDRTPFLGRKVEVTGLLMKDMNENIRVQLTDGKYPWILEPTSVDTSLMGSTVQVVGVTTGAQTLKVMGMSRAAQ